MLRFSAAAQGDVSTSMATAADPSSASWSSGTTHQEQVVVTWTTRAGQTFELNDYGSAGPPAVAALAAALETAGRRIEWSAVEHGDGGAPAPR